MVFESIGVFLSKISFFYAYVDNQSSFPKPLKKEEEEKLIHLVQTKNDEKARKKLIGHNMRLVAHVVKKYASTMEADDLIGVGSLGLIKAINSFNLEKGASLSTYAAKCIENEILMLIRANKKHIPVDSLDEHIGLDKDGNELSLVETIPDESENLFNRADTTILTEYLDSIMKNNLSDREYFVIKYRYGFNNTPVYTQREVAKMLNISRSYISRIEKKALEIIRKNVNANSIYTD